MKRLKFSMVGCLLSASIIIGCSSSAIEEPAAATWEPDPGIDGLSENGNETENLDDIVGKIPLDFMGWELQWDQKYINENTDLDHYIDQEIALAEYTRGWKDEDKYAWIRMAQIEDPELYDLVYDNVLSDFTFNDIEFLDDVTFFVRDEQGNALFVLFYGDYVIQTGVVSLNIKNPISGEEWEELQSLGYDIVSVLDEAVAKSIQLQADQRKMQLTYLRNTKMAKNRTAYPVNYRQIQNGTLGITEKKVNVGENAYAKVNVVTNYQRDRDDNLICIVSLYVKEIDVGDDDGDDSWTRGFGDIFVAGTLTIHAEQHHFLSPEITYLESSKSKKNQRKTWENYGRPIGEYKINYGKSENQPLKENANLAFIIRDNDSNGLLDCLANVVKNLSGQTGEKILKEIQNYLDSKSFETIYGNLVMIKVAEEIKGNTIGAPWNEPIEINLPKKIPPKILPASSND